MSPSSRTVRRTCSLSSAIWTVIRVASRAWHIALATDSCAIRYRTTVTLGVTGLAAATAVLVGVPAMGAVGVFALIGFHFTLGWKTHKVARAPHSRMFGGV